MLLVGELAQHSDWPAFNEVALTGGHTELPGQSKKRFLQVLAQ